MIESVKYVRTESHVFAPIERICVREDGHEYKTHLTDDEFTLEAAAVAEFALTDETFNRTRVAHADVVSLDERRSRQ